MDLMENKNEYDINWGYWYIPVESKELEDVKKEIELDNIILKEIKGKNILCIGINDNEGKFDDYLASLISELHYVQSLSEIYKNNREELNSENRLKELNVIDKTHEDVIFLKRLYYKVIYNLNKLAEHISSRSDSVKAQEDFFLSNAKYFYDEYYHLRCHNRFRYHYRFRYYIEWFMSWLDEYYILDLLEEYDDESIHQVLRHTFGNASRKDINRLINIWTAIFCIGLGTNHNNISVSNVFSDNILTNNISTVDEALGKSQIKCCLCYMQTSKKEYEDLIRSAPRIRRFKRILSMNKELSKAYFDKKAVRCYSQMWIDKCETQYFALSCSPDTEKKVKYYKIAKNLLNLNQSHSKYEPALFNEDMRYYYSEGANDYIDYSYAKKTMDNRNINIMFSCCERKLLTIVEKHKRDSGLDNKVVHICVKYSPCEICHRALISYEKNGLIFEIITPKDRGNRSKYLEIDTAVKKILKLNPPLS